MDLGTFGSADGDGRHCTAKAGAGHGDRDAACSGASSSFLAIIMTTGYSRDHRRRAERVGIDAGDRLSPRVLAGRHSKHIAGSEARARLADDGGGGGVLWHEMAHTWLLAGDGGKCHFHGRRETLSVESDEITRSGMALDKGRGQSALKEPNGATVNHWILKRHRVSAQARALSFHPYREDITSSHASGGRLAANFRIGDAEDGGACKGIRSGSGSIPYHHLLLPLAKIASSKHHRLAAFEQQIRHHVRVVDDSGRYSLNSQGLGSEEGGRVGQERSRTLLYHTRGRGSATNGDIHKLTPTRRQNAGQGGMGLGHLESGTEVVSDRHTQARNRSAKIQALNGQQQATRHRTDGGVRH